MADPVDELEVLVSLDLGPLEDDLEEAVDKMDRLDDQTTDDVEEELDDAAESADDLSNSLDGADARAIDIDVDDSEVQAAENAVEDLDGKEANVDVDVDRERLRGALSGSGGEHELQRALEMIEDGLEDAQEEAERLDDEDPSVDVDADVADEQRKLQAALNTVRALNSKDADIDVDADGVQETITEGVAAAQRLDDLEADIDLNVDRDGLRRAVSRLSLPDGGGGSASGRRDRVRLPGELDEIQEAARAFGRLPPQVKALSGALAASAAALGAAGGLAGAATALATRFGGLQLRQDLQKLKQRFRSLGATFVDAFEPIIRNTVIPAGVALAEELRSVIPELKSFTQNNLPTLVGAVQGLVQAILGTAQAFGLVARTLGILTSAVQALVNAFGAQQGFSGQAIQENVQSEFVDILQGFGFGGQGIGVPGASFQVPQTEVQSIVEQIRSGARSISGVGGGARTGGGAVARQGAGSFPLTEDLRKIKRQIAVAREKFQRLESFTRKDLQQALVNLRQKGVDALLMMERKTGEAQAQTKDWISALEEAQRKSAAFSKAFTLPTMPDGLFPGAGKPNEPQNPPEIVPPSEVSSDPTTDEGTTAGFASVPIQNVNEELERIDSLPQLMKGQKAKRQVGAVVQAVRRLQDEGKLLTQSGLDEFLKGLDITDKQKEKILDRFRGIQNAAESLGATLKNVAVQGLSQLTSGIGRAFGGALLADARRVQRLEQRRRRIQQNLRQARQAGKFGQVRQLQKDLTKVNNKLDKTKSLFGRIGQAFKSFGNIAKQVLEQVISKLISAATLALALAPFTGGLSSFGGNFATILGGGIPELASGGIVTGPTLAMVGEGNESEAVMPLSKLESMMQPNQEVSVNLAAEARVEGSDLVVGIRQALNEEAAIGGPGRL